MKYSQISVAKQIQSPKFMSEIRNLKVFKPRESHDVVLKASAYRLS